MKSIVRILPAASFVLGASAPAATVTYRNLILADDPIVYYELDEDSGTTTINSAATGVTYEGTFDTSGSPITVGQASFPGGGSAYDFGGGFVGAASGITNALEEWTVEAWVNYDPAKVSASNFLSNDQGGWNDDVIIGIGAENGTVGVPAGQVGVIQQGNPGATRDFAASPLSAGEWHHVVVTGSHSTGELSLFVDGVLVASDTSLSNRVTFNGADGIGSANLTIGAARPDSGDPAYRSYDGLLDELAIYGKVLDGATIANHHRAGSLTSGTPPMIVALSPANGADDAVVSADLVARFSEPVVLTGRGSVSLRNLTLGSEALTVIDLPDSRVSVSGFSFVIDPGSNLALNTNYAVEISADAIVDRSGNPFPGIANDTIWNFTVPSIAATFGLRVVNYAPEETGPQLRWPTHFAFGPGHREIITDLKNNRFLYRNSSDDLWQSSPVSSGGLIRLSTTRLTGFTMPTTPTINASSPSAIWPMTPLLLRPAPLPG